MTPRTAWNHAIMVSSDYHLWDIQLRRADRSLATKAEKNAGGHKAGQRQVS
jgi:hypothetical protein